MQLLARLYVGVQPFDTPKPLAQAVPVGFDGWFVAAVYGLALGLVAGGIYDAGVSVAKTLQSYN